MLFGSILVMVTDKRSPRISNIIIEPDAIYHVNSFCKKLDCGKNILLIYDKNTKDIAGDKIYDELKRSKDVYTFMISDADEKNIKGAIDEIEKNEVDVIFGIGGGKSIDVAKLSSYSAGKKFVSVPTACSHDGIASERASIMYNGYKISKKAHAPLGVIADTNIISKSPHNTYTAGLADLISNVTAVADWYVAKKMIGEEVNDRAATESLLAASYIIDDCDEIKVQTESSIREVVHSLINSGKAMQMAGSSRPASGFEHKISHALDKILSNPKMHGHQCGLGTLFSVAAHEKYAKPCTYNFSQITKAFNTLCIPSTLKQVGIPRKAFVEAVYMTPEISDRYTIFEATKIDVEGLIDEIGL